jgi:hypothetical protein
VAQLTVEHADTLGNITGEFRLAKDVRVVAARNAPTTVGFTTNARDDDAAQLVADNVSRVLVHLDDDLITHTLVQGSIDKGSGASETLTVAAADPLKATLGRRIRQAGSVYGIAGTSVTFTSTEQAEIARALVAAENGRGDTFLRTNTLAIPTTGVVRTVTVEQGKPIVQQILDMANAFDGFDVAAVPYHQKGSSVMADLGIWSSRGTIRENIVLDYNAGGVSNIDEYDREVDGTRETSNQAVVGSAGNRVVAPGATASGLVLDSEDQLSDVTDTTLLTLYAQQLQTWRASPHELLAVKLANTADILPVRDFDIGDYLTVQMVAARFALDGLVRVYGWTLIRNEAGEAQCESILLSPGDQGNG